MRKKQIDIEIASKLEIIEKLSTVKRPDWLLNQSVEIYKIYQTLRKDIKNNQTTWNYFEYCHRLSVNYYNIANVYYKYFVQHKADVNIIKISLDKCLSKLNGIRSTEREINKTESLFGKAVKMQEAINKIYINLENKLNNTDDKLEKAKYLVNLGHVDYENFNFLGEDLQLYHSYVLGIYLINIISDVEEILTVYPDKDHYNKANLCQSIARAYEICGQQQFHDEYIMSANKQIKLAFEEMGIEDQTSTKLKQIKNIVKIQVIDYNNNLVEVYKTINTEYQQELNHLDCVYIEQIYIKYCSEGFIENIKQTLNSIAKTNNKNIFMLLISNMEKIKTLSDLQDYFTLNAYYKLLIEHKNLLRLEQEKQIIKQYKTDLWDIISPQITEAQVELDVLKQIILFLRSGLEDCRSIINQMELSKFCNRKISVQKFINNILNLEINNNVDLINLKNSSVEIKDKKELFFMDKFIEILQSYAFPPEPRIEGDLIIVEGRLIILSEVIQHILKKKLDYIKELRIIGADIFTIDKSLENDIWTSMNILVISKTILVKGNQTWDVSGLNAKEHEQAKAANGQKRGEDGKNGKHGQCGKSGGNVYISCFNIINSENITIKSNGGNGSNGQSGGNGKTGNDGYGIPSSEFENLINPYKPSRSFKIYNKMKTYDISWSKKLFRFNAEPDHSYLAGKTENECYIHYSFYPGVIIWKDEALVLHIGTHAEIGGSGGKAGLAGPGGFTGDVTIKCSHPVDIVVERNIGKSGKQGKNGNNGSPGSNGWDMGFVFCNGWFSSTRKIIGKNQNFKIEMQYRNGRVDDDYVYIPYRYDVLNRSDYYAGLKMSSKETQIINRNTNKNQEQEQRNEATRIRAISRSAITQCEENIQNDVLDELANLSMQMQNLKEQAQEGMEQKDEEMESEMTQFQVQRQAVFDDSSLQKENKILRKRQKDKKPYTRSITVEKILINPKSIELWYSLRPVVVNLEDLQKLFSLLFENKIYVQNKYSELYKILLDKYKIGICQEIDKKCQLPDIEVLFTPNPIEKYLVVDSTTKEFSHEKLGILQEYFQPDHENLLKKLQNFLQNVDIGLIIYSLKFFILEKSYNDSKFEQKYKIILEKLNNLEKKLDTLIKCYFIAFEKNENTTMLYEIEKYKNKLIDQFKLEKQNEFILKEFSEYIINIGMSSTAVRELLAIAFRVNIKIFVINQNNEFILMHNHNPSSKEPFYLFLVNGQFVQFHIDEKYLNLITERKKISKNYSDLLAFINKFVCKKDFDEFYKNFNLFKGYESRENMYLEYKKVSTGDLIKEICNYFPRSEYAEIYSVVSKLQSGYIENENILKAVLQRFDCEGKHVTLDEMMYLVDVILKSFLDKNVDLELFEWIISVKPQSIWVNELFYIELETYFKISLKNTDVYKYIENVQQKTILLLMHIKLKEATDNINLEYVTKCLQTMSEIEVDEETVKTLPLSKWRYTLREQLLENRLYCLTKWNSVDELQRALYYINCLDSNVGSDLINKFIANLKKKSQGIPSKNYLEIFSLLYTQEWSLNEELLNKISENGINSIKTELEIAERKINETRSLETVMKLILENSNTSPVIKTTLNNLRTHPILSLKIDVPHSGDEINKWAKQFKERIHEFNDDKKKFIAENTVEILTMIMHAIKLKKGFELRTVQRLSILLMLCHNENALAQIGTGEGKSIIVVTVSIFKALFGEKVDIVTSSSVLAIRDATINKDIYDIFDVKVHHNCSEKLDDRRDAYSECPIIFGDLSNYQRDYLLDRFYGKNILGDRNFDTILVDEVDSMLLDKGNNTLYLSHDIPGLEKLESVYQFLWRKICLSVGQNIENFDDYLKKDVIFDLYGTLSIDDLVSSLNITIPVATNIYNYLKDSKVINQKSIVLKTLSAKDVSNLPKDLKPLESKLNYILNLILKRETEIKIPKCLYQFVENHLDTWIKNGLLAIVMEEGIDYVVDVDRTNTKADITPNITIIDKGTGTDQSNSQWEEALHQFLQLKHGCKISPQSLKAVFISNVSYFRKYNTLFGLTGTLGSTVERDLLKELYDVQFVNIPTAKPKKFIEHEPLLCCTETDWQYSIVNRTQELTKANRSVLIICETIKEVNNLAKAFQQSSIPDRSIYKREYEECTFAQGKEKLDCGKIIIATNLAGRGTDIKITEKLNEYGGLHVLVTYLPNSARIEQQAFGRAARAGSNGSGQLVIIGCGTFMDKREMREAQERQRIADIKKYFDTRIKGEEKYFNKFNEIYKECNNSWLEIFTDKKIKEIASQRLLDRWAFWLDKYGNNLTEKPVEMNKNFENFISNLKSNFSVWTTWTDDPTHLVKIGLNYINKGKLMDSVDVFDIVIKQEPIFSEAAHYYKALALGQLLNFEKRPFYGAAEKTYQDFLLELRKAKNLFEAQKDICMASSAYVQNLKQKMKNSFMTIDAYKSQQETMIILYDLYIKSIDDILGHSVTKSSFISQEIIQENSEEMYESFLNKSILKYSRVVKSNTADIEEISTSFGIPFNILSSYVSSYENKDIKEQDFLEDLKRKIKMPNLEECWDVFVKQKILTDEMKLVIIDKSKLTTSQEDTLKKISQVNVNIKTCEGKYVLMKQYVEEDKDTFIFEEDILKREIDFYETLRKERSLVCNRIAQLSKDKNKSFPIGLYDSLTLENLTSNGIKESEAVEILNTLCKETFLKKDKNCYELVSEYDESNIPRIPAYEQNVIQILRLNFAYRIACQNLQTDIENVEEQVYLKVISEPHISLMWELNGRKIIEPVYVENHTSGDISPILSHYGKSDQKESIDKYVKSVLKNLAGSLKSLDTPSFKIIPITDCLDEIQVSHLQELNTFLINSLDYIIKSEEKKYTLKMILSTLFVTILGILEIVAGLCIQLFSAGALSHLGNYLISEGLSDLQYAVSCWWSGYFDWSDYGQYKLKSMLESLIFAAVGAAFSRVAKLSKFGEKIAMSGIKNQFGKEISKLTGKELIKEVGGKTIVKEFSKKVIRKVGEGIVEGIVNEGINHVVDSYLQNLCNQLSNSMVQDIGTAVDKHSIGVTLVEFCKIFGPKEGKEKIVYYTEKCLSETTIASAVVETANKIVSKVSGVCREATKLNINVPYVKFVKILSEVLRYTQYLTYISDIISSVKRVLDNVDHKMKNDIKEAKAKGVKDKKIDDKEVNKFKNEIIVEWRDLIQQKSNSVFSDRIAKPILNKCASIIVNKSKENMKSLYHFGKKTYHRHVFNKIKQKKDTKLENTTISEETQKEIIKSYTETLQKLQEKIRDPYLYADIVMEKGYMDAICIKAGSIVLGNLREDKRPVSLKIKTDTGNSVEFNTPGTGNTRNINIELKNNHFQYEQADNEESLQDYECLYKAIAQKFPELNKISAEEFRTMISHEIQKNKEIKTIIRSGKHAFTIRQSIYGGYTDKNIATDELRSALMDGRYAMSQSSISERTSTGLHLSELAASITEHFDEKGRINVVESDTGEYIFLDNRRVIAAATINNPTVNILVRVFQYDEILPRTLQDQYRSRTAGRAAEVRIKKSFSFDNNDEDVVPYHPSEIRIRGKRAEGLSDKQKEREMKKQIEIFNKKLQDMQFIIYRRPPATSKADSRKRKHKIKSAEV